MESKKLMRSLAASVLCWVAVVVGVASASAPEPAAPAASAAPSILPDITMVVATIAGIALGLRSAFDHQSQKRIATLEARVDEAEDQRHALRQAQHDAEIKHADEIERVKAEYAKRINEAAKCPWPRPDGIARCEGLDAPKPAEPGEVFNARP
jgi:hypothetical protein